MIRQPNPNSDFNGTSSISVAGIRAWGLLRQWLGCVAILVTGLRAHGTQYRYDVWKVESGLPQNIVRGIAQTPDGYLWIATLDGLARFDGVRFTVFNKSNTPQITSNRFSSMVEGSNGDLWLVNEAGALTRYHLGSFHTYSAQDGIPADSVRAITSDGAGNVWILSGESILQLGRNGELVDITPANHKIHYEPLYWDSGGFWGIDHTKILIFLRGSFVSYALPGWLPAKSVWAIGINHDGSVWIEDFKEKQAVIPAGQQNVKKVNGPASSQYSYRDVHGNLWKMHVEPRLERFFDFDSSGQAASIPMRWLLEDREGNVWIGTEGNGLYRLQEQSIQVYSKAAGLADSNIYPIYQDRNGAVWLGAWATGLSRFMDGRFTNYTESQGLPGPRVSALTEDHNGSLWVATRSNLAVLQDRHFERPASIVLPALAVVQAIIQDRGGTMWIGTSNGLVLYRDGPGKILTAQDGLAANDVRAILEGRSGDIWIGGYGGLTRVHGGQFTRWTEHDGLPSNNIRALYEDRDGVIWIGTYDGGLGRLKDGKFTCYRERDGLFNNGVFQILEDGRGNFWMSSNRGIYRVSKQELDAFANGTLATITSVAYGTSDGMLNVECNGGMWPAGIRTRDGKLWFPTQNGVAVVDPSIVHINLQPPPVVIETALIDHQPVTLDSRLRVPPGRENVEIEYTALSFVHSDQIRFRYKMEGLDTNWIEAGSRRTAYYSHLAPGDYQFHVIARNGDGVWNAAGQTLAVRVLAPFYRTWWFTLLEIAGLAALVLLAVRYRIGQLQHEQALQKAFSQQLIASQESERQRIPAELHDSLGQRLVVINNLALFSMRAKVKAGGNADEDDAFKEISEETSLAIQETREISYNLRPFQLDRLGLTKAIEGIVRSVISASGLNITSELDNIDDLFAVDLRINLYRIVQEALNNIMKHAHATQVHIKILRNSDRMILTIRDNGVGFSPNARPSKGGKSGFGLTGMVERAHLLGGEVQFNSAPGQGTILTMEFRPGAKVAP